MVVSSFNITGTLTLNDLSTLNLGTLQYTRAGEEQVVEPTEVPILIDAVGIMSGTITVEGKAYSEQFSSDMPDFVQIATSLLTNLEDL